MSPTLVARLGTSCASITVTRYEEYAVQRRAALLATSRPGGGPEAAAGTKRAAGGEAVREGRPAQRQRQPVQRLAADEGVSSGDEAAVDQQGRCAIM